MKLSHKIEVIALELIVFYWNEKKFVSINCFILSIEFTFIIECYSLLTKPTFFAVKKRNKKSKYEFLTFINYSQM